MNKKKFKLALKSKINLLNNSINKFKNEKHFENIFELQIKVSSYEDILKAVEKGTFDL